MDKPKETVKGSAITDENQLMNLHLVMISVASMGALALIIEGTLLKWEFWMLPLIAIATVAMWVLYVLQLYTPKSREICYVAFTIFLALFHGVHYTSFFDVALMSVLMMISFAGADNRRYLDYALVEYFFVMCAQFYLAGANGGLSRDTLTISRIILHFATVIIIYNICRNSVIQRIRTRNRINSYIEEADSANESLEDFLSNISHEFRTPINVVTGMSALMMNEKTDDRIMAINGAGQRLADQVGDILDYNEILSDRLLIARDKYMITSLINDVIQDVHEMTEQKELELIVDLDPSVPAVLVGDSARIHKMIRHLISNSVKFTDQGCIYLKVSATRRDYGVNLDIEVADTGRGMPNEVRSLLANKLYQADKARNRSTGGIGLGLTIVYGFAHAMDGFVRVESTPGRGTMIRVSIPQTVSSHNPCLELEQDAGRCVVVYTRTEKYKIPEVRDYYHRMIENLSRGLKVPIYSVPSLNNLKSVCERMNVTNLFMGQEEYEEDREFFDIIAKKFCVAVSVSEGFKVSEGSPILYMIKPLYALPIINIVNAGKQYKTVKVNKVAARPYFTGVRALIVDDEDMNLVVASGLFKDYGMITDVAGSGKEAISKFRDNDYDVIFMDHMMPEMDGVEAMKRLKALGRETGREVAIVALTANAVSGAREMFISEGFDGFIAKPIELTEYERVMKRVLPSSLVKYRGGDGR
ncbi:MAG: response regulator [Lachnospiraceae bacterium]|nr:response regulator [Lachnospiraceae bacterium]